LRVLEFCVFFLTQIEDVDQEVEKASYERDGTQNAEGYAKAVHSDKQTSANILPVPHLKNDGIVLIFLNYLHNLFCAVRIKIT
jgi:hypothetical protein